MDTVVSTVAVLTGAGAVCLQTTRGVTRATPYMGQVVGEHFGWPVSGPVRLWQQPSHLPCQGQGLMRYLWWLKGHQPWVGWRE